MAFMSGPALQGAGEPPRKLRRRVSRCDVGVIGRSTGDIVPEIEHGFTARNFVETHEQRRLSTAPRWRCWLPRRLLCFGWRSWVRRPLCTLARRHSVDNQQHARTRCSPCKRHRLPRRLPSVANGLGPSQWCRRCARWTCVSSTQGSESRGKTSGAAVATATQCRTFGRIRRWCGGTSAISPRTIASSRPSGQRRPTARRKSSPGLAATVSRSADCVCASMSASASTTTSDTPIGPSSSRAGYATQGLQNRCPRARSSRPRLVPAHPPHMRTGPRPIRNLRAMPTHTISPGRPLGRLHSLELPTSSCRLTTIHPASPPRHHNPHIQPTQTQLRGMGPFNANPGKQSLSCTKRACHARSSLCRRPAPLIEPPSPRPPRAAALLA